MPITATFLEQGGQPPSEIAALLAAFFRAAQSTLHLAVYDFRLSDSLATPLIEALRERVSAGGESFHSLLARTPPPPPSHSSAAPPPPRPAHLPHPSVSRTLPH